MGLATRCEVYHKGSEAECAAFEADSVRRKGLPVREGGVVQVLVNDGRWIANCTNPFCKVGLACSPGVETVLCMECGTRYHVVFSPEWQAVEAALVKRPQKARHWWPGVTVAELEQQNIAEGLDPDNELVQLRSRLAELERVVAQQVRAVPTVTPMAGEGG